MLTVAGPSRTLTGFRRQRLVAAYRRSPRTLSLVPIPVQRALTDRCPGLLRPFIADDGAIIRLRVPGGGLATSTLVELAALARAYGAPVVQLTSRGNLQLRALPDPLPAPLIEAVEATGLLPSATHERVRNILASPLAGHLQGLVAQLDAALVAEPAFAELPGRFLFAVADETGDVLRAPWDLAYQQLSATAGLLLARTGEPLGIPCAPTDAVTGLVERAAAFLEHRPQRAWNIRDLPARSPALAGLTPCRPEVAEPPAPGIHGEAVIVGVPLGMLDPAQAEALAQAGERVVLTPWRSIVVPDGAAHMDLLAAVGLITTAGDPRGRVSACVGAPYCRRTSTPTLRIAADVASALAANAAGAGAHIHVVGCERRCGATAVSTVVVAPASERDVLAQVRRELGGIS